MKRRCEAIQQAARTSFDVCVIGGGATGAGCALDAQLRGFKTILVEAGDFASGTSSVSTKLIHGGLRYLQQAVTELDLAQYRVVRRALRERRLMMQNAPHLSWVREFLVPCFNLVELVYYSAGLKLYDRLSGDARLSRSQFVGRTATLARMPGLKSQDLFGTIVYTDGQFDDARFNLALVQSCSASGGEVLNYARVIGFEKNNDGRLVAAQIEDCESKQRFSIAAQAFVNATGPFSDCLRQLATGDSEQRLKLSKGVHILLPLPEDFGGRALLMPNTEDHRVLFAIPWLGRLLVGTTDTESSLDAELIVTREEADFLLRHLNRYVVRQFALTDIVSAIAGLRPLIQTGHSRETKKLARDYEVAADATTGLISVMGGKWTVYRAMAEHAIDAVEELLRGQVTGCRTHGYRLFGAEEIGAGRIEISPESYRVSQGTMLHLKEKFGSRSSHVLNLAHEDASLLSSITDGAPQIGAEVVYCAREEMALTIDDVLSRRLGLQFFDWRLAIRAAPVVGQLLARELDWTPMRTQEEIRRYIVRIERFFRALGIED